MDEQAVFAFLHKQKKAALLNYLHSAYDEMTPEQRRAVFAGAVRPPPKPLVDADQLRKEIDEFRRDSLARKYYAPFMTNSKNFMEIPAKTREWCQRFAGFVADARSLTARKEHAHAVACFAVLYQLLGALEWGKEIIFAEEAGSWLIPTDHRAWPKAYLKSLAACTNPEEFTAAAIPLLERDGRHSFADEVYAAAIKAANRRQRAYLEAELDRRQIRRGPPA